MRRGTTPTITLTCDDLDFTQMKSIYITLAQQMGWKKTVRENDLNLEISEHELKVYLTQEDTLRFHNGVVQVQVRALTSDGVAVATDISSFDIGPVLYDGVIS